MVHREAQLGEEGVPEGQQLPHIQAQGQPDLAPPAGDGLVAQDQLALVFVEVPLPGVRLAGDGPVAAIAADEGGPVGEGVDGQLAVVAAQAAHPALRLLAEIRQSLAVQKRADLVRPGLAPAEQGRAIGAHEACDIGPDDLHAHLLLKGTQHRLVVEGAALHHDVPAQLLGGRGPDHLIDGVLHHRDGEAGGDILDGGPVLLGLLHRGVHKHGAAAAQVHRPLGKEAQPGELLHIIAQCLGEGLQEAAAAGGAGLV